MSLIKTLENRAGPGKAESQGKGKQTTGEKKKVHMISQDINQTTTKPTTPPCCSPGAIKNRIQNIRKLVCTKQPELSRPNNKYLQVWGFFLF